MQKKRQKLCKTFENYYEIREFWKKKITKNRSKLAQKTRVFGAALAKCCRVWVVRRRRKKILRIQVTNAVREQCKMAVAGGG